MSRGRTRTSSEGQIAALTVVFLHSVSGARSPHIPPGPHLGQTAAQVFTDFGHFSSGQPLYRGCCCACRECLLLAETVDTRFFGRMGCSDWTGSALDVAATESECGSAVVATTAVMAVAGRCCSRSRSTAASACPPCCMAIRF